jgi:dCMP deaminase
VSSWTEYYIGLLPAIASKSKDPSTKVGCVIVGPNNNIISTGFNGFPKRVQDNPVEFAHRYERPAKYTFTVHAEVNAVANAAAHGIATLGATAYVSLPPCTECAKVLIQAGIVRVVFDKQNMDAWVSRNQSGYISDTQSHAAILLDEARVSVVAFSPGVSK